MLMFFLHPFMVILGMIDYCLTHMMEIDENCPFMENLPSMVMEN